MKSNLIIVCILLSTAIRGNSQENSPPAQLPPGPLVVTQMPDHSQWTIDYTYTDSLKPGAESSEITRYRELAKNDPALAKQMSDPLFLAMLNPPRPLHVVATKTGKVWHIEQNLDQGQTAETWGNDQLTGVRKPGMAKYNVFLNDNSRRVDFPEFFWITKEGFAGMEVVDGQQCLTFRRNVDPAAIQSPGHTSNTKVPAVAYIDLKTRYPVSLQFGVETRKYTYQEPTSDLALPDEIASAGKAALARLQALVPTPSTR
jgi:hypothetical protein